MWKETSKETQGDNKPTNNKKKTNEVSEIEMLFLIIILNILKGNPFIGILNLVYTSKEKRNCFQKKINGHNVIVLARQQIIWQCTSIPYIIFWCQKFVSFSHIYNKQKSSALMRMYICLRTKIYSLSSLNKFNYCTLKVESYSSSAIYFFLLALSAFHSLHTHFIETKDK